MLNKFATQLFNKEKDYFTLEELDLYLKDKDYIYNGYSKINHNYDYLYENSQLKYAFNNSAYSFLMNVDLEEDVNNHSVRDVKSYYTRFCEENDLNQLGANKFNTELIKLGYKQKNIRAQYLKLGHHHGQDVIDQVEDEIDDNKVVKAWVKA